MQEASYIGLSIVAFAVVFGLIWTGVLSLLSFLGGWMSLAREFPAMGRIEGSLFRWCSARFSLFTNYSNCLTIIVSDSALYMRTNMFLRFAHKPLLIPREAVIDYSSGSTFLFRTAKLTLARKGNRENTTLTLYGRGLIEALDHWVGEELAAQAEQPTAN